MIAVDRQFKICNIEEALKPKRLCDFKGKLVNTIHQHSLVQEGGIYNNTNHMHRHEYRNMFIDFIQPI